MGRVTIGIDNGDNIIQNEIVSEQAPIAMKEVAPIIIEVPVEKIVTVEKLIEVPIIQIQEKIVEKPIEVIKEVIVEKQVPIEIIKEVIIEKEIRVVDIEPLLKEKERVRYYKKSNAIYRALFLILLFGSLTIIGAMHG